MKTFEIVLSEDRSVTMTMYLNLESQEFGHTKRPMMIVLPGGGYNICSDREAEIVALQYMSAGYQACVLRYTLKGKAGWPHPLNDYDEAVKTIAQHAEEWRIDMDRIATVGFSAGGHLAACTATLAKHKPRAAICVYPAILPEIVDACQPGMPYPHEHADSKTSPCFIVATRNDGIVNVNNSLTFAQALEKAGVSFELHIYSYGQHGFSIATPLAANTSITPRAASWVADSIGWLGEIMGTLTDRGFTEPILSTQLNADFDAYLSVKCSFAHVRKQQEAVQVLIEPLYAGIRAVANERNIPYEAMCDAIGTYTIKDLLDILNMPVDTILQLNTALNAIPNSLHKID